jgi:hypothetical protein
MNDDNFTDSDDVDLRDYRIAEKAFSDIRSNDRSPMEAFGIILGMVANQFKKHGWTRQDFVDFLSTLQETDWPDDPKKKTNLTLVKK